jgi:hypothetical protein
MLELSNTVATAQTHMTAAFTANFNNAPNEQRFLVSAPADFSNA